MITLNNMNISFGSIPYGPVTYARGWQAQGQVSWEGNDGTQQRATWTIVVDTDEYTTTQGLQSFLENKGCTNIKVQDRTIDGQAGADGQCLYNYELLDGTAKSEMHYVAIFPIPNLDGFVCEIDSTNPNIRNDMERTIGMDT